MMRNGILWLAFSQNSGSHLKICNNVFEQRVSVLYNNCGIESLSFNNSTCSADSKAIGVGIFLEPCKEQTVTIGFSSVTVVAHVKQYVKMLHKELTQNGQDSLFDFGVVGRTNLIYLINNELIGVTSAKGAFFFKRDGIVNAAFCLKYVVAFWRQHHIIKRMRINRVKGKLNHSDTMVPVIPLRFHSSAMRFSATRLISSDRLKRANASSYVTFLISIFYIVLYLRGKDTKIL